MERADDVLIGGGSSTSSGMLNGSSVGVGGGGGENINAVMSSMSTSNTTTTNSTSSGVGTSSSTAGNTSSSSYTMPGILHYLQHEWNRFEYERQQWEIDRAELMSKISFLQGERRGQENLKNNLIRRIKMLELALKQERVKYHKLMYGVEPNTNELKSNTSNTNLSNENNDGNNDIENGTFSIGQHPILNKENAANSSASIKQGRQLLKQYLQEIGYADTIIDIRSARLRGLLGLKNAAAAAAASAAAQGGYDEQAAQSNEHLTNGCGRRVGGPNSATSFTVAAVAAAAGYANQLNGCLNASDLQKMLKLTEGSADAKSLDFLNNQIAAAAAAAAAATNGDNRNSRSGYDDEEEASEEDEMQRQRQQQQQQQRATNKNGSGDTTSSSCEFQAPGGVDSDTEDALKEFAFLSNEISSPSSSSSSSSSSASSSSSEIDGAAGAGGVGTDWNVDREKIARLTELYKKDRKSSKTAKQQQQQQTSSLGSHTVQRPNRAELKAMIANLTETAQSGGSGQGDDSSPADIESPGSTAGENKAKSDQQQQQQQINSMTSFSNNAKMFLEDDAFANDANLGELSRISVNNSVNLSGLNDETVIDSQRKTIYNKYTLRGHLDGVRCVAFHPTESVLLSGSEDQTIKLWNLDKISQNNKKSGTTDVEPIYTFRKHTGPVLSLVMSANGDYCISSGLDANIIIWNMPSYETDQYDIYSPNVYVKNLNGHTDAVWNMALIDNTLVSVSADSTIRVWNPFSIDDLNEASSTSISCLNENKSEGVATSVDFINGEKSRIVASFGSTHHNMYDIETSKLISKFDYYDSKINTHCYKVISHPATASPSSSSLIVSAHEDKKIRFFDINSGKMVYHMVAHQDACTDLAIDPSCFYLLSSSHDCSIRLWNLENKNCIQEMTCHRKKYDESINCVSFHPTKPFIASGGADAVVKIYV